MKKLMLFVMCLFLSSQAFTQGLLLHFGGQVFFGQNTINIRQEIRRRFPQYPLRGAIIRRMMVHSKSQNGNSNMVLTSFQNQWPRSTAPFYIPGNQWQFNQPGGFFPIEIYNPTPNSYGHMNLTLKGPVNLMGIELDIIPGNIGPGFPPTDGSLGKPVSIGMKKASKTSTDHYAFFPEWKRVGAIVFKAHSNDIKVKNVRITFDNGEVQIINSLRGYYNEFEQKTFNLSGRVIREITTNIRSANQIGRHGKLEVSVRYFRR